MKVIRVAVSMSLALAVVTAEAASGGPEKALKTLAADLDGNGEKEKVTVVQRGGRGEAQFVVAVEARGGRKEFKLGGNSFGELRVTKTKGKQELVVVDAADCGASCSATYLLVIGYAGPVGPEALIEEEMTKASVRIRDQGIETLESVYGPDDPMCCPSKFRFTRYEMRGEDLKRVKGQLVSSDASEAQGWR